MTVRTKAAGGALLILLCGALLLAHGCAKSVGPDGHDGEEDADIPDGANDDGCPGGTVLCGGACVNTSSDHANCGGCGRACDSFEVCYGGDCMLECPSGLSDCSGDCVDLATDRQHCGSCGNACGTDVPCIDGTCTVYLTGPLSGLKDHAGATVIINGAVTVTAYNGSDDVSTCDVGETGCLRIVADEIVLEAGAAIVASGKGYGGGGGGGGGAGNAGGPCNGNCSVCHGGGAGSGAAGGASGGEGGISGSDSTGGAGGKGGGSFGGAGGPGVVSSGSEGPDGGNGGGAGGYVGRPGFNDDASTDESILMGSGGGGGSGGAGAYEPCYYSVGGSGGGGAGNPGGGYVELVATTSIDILGSVSTAGLASSTGDGAQGDDGYRGSWKCDLGGHGGGGGSASSSGSSDGGGGVDGFFDGTQINTCIDRDCGSTACPSGSARGGSGGDGGPGAGGGVLLKAPQVTIAGTIDALGGGSAAVNGGTVKVFHRGTEPSASGILSGKTLITTY